MSSDGRRRVNFSDSPPGGGSKSSSRHNSDSGVGSSDHHRPTSAAGTNPDRGFTERDVERQWNDLGALQGAYRALYDSEKRMKSKFRELEEENSRLRRELKEDERRDKEQYDEIQKLKEDKDKYANERKILAEENGQLKGRNNALAAQLDEAIARIEDLERELRTSPVPEIMSGALPRDAAPSKPKRRDSVSKKRDAKREEKEAKEDKKRLSKRFELNKDGAEVSKPPNSSRTRRQSYIEPLGPAVPSSRSSASIPPSPTTSTGRQFTTFSQAPMREPTYSELPRTVPPSVHPTFTVHDPSYPDEGVAWQEDGKYHPYPLPPKPHKPPYHRSKSSYER